jgi:hypothetical protein
MGRGARFTDEHSGILFNIRGPSRQLTWVEATEIFNRAFPEEPPRGVDALRQQYRLKQKGAWERANANHADRDEWNQTVEDAIADQAANPNRPLLTKAPDPNSRWTHAMRQACHLLVQDTSLEASERARIFNTLFEYLLRTQGRGPLSARALRRVYRTNAKHSDNKQKDKKVDAEVEDEDDVEGSPTKKRKFSVQDVSELTASESWAVVLSKVKTEQEQESVKTWQEKIKQQKLVMTNVVQPVVQPSVQSAVQSAVQPVIQPLSQPAIQPASQPAG